MKKTNMYLLLFVGVASFVLIAVNSYTIKILSGVRAYINGESEYSKGQKDAVLYLSTFITTEDTAYLRSFKESIAVPMGDNLARKSLLSGGKDQAIANYFVIGRNHPSDIGDMIWLFRTFRTTYMKTPISIWTDAEVYIDELYNTGMEVSYKIEHNSLSARERLEAAKKISAISARLYELESRFSKVLGDTAREVRDYLFFANLFCILVIIGNIALYASRMIKRLNASNLILKAKNDEVSEINKELDTLVYSLSHDLRSPITSIKGLINLLREEDDLERLKEFADDMDHIIDSQDAFILEIIDFFKSKRSMVSYSQFSLKRLIEDIVDNNKFIPAAQDILINREIGLDMICADELRLKIIVSNLLSNAIKYSDERKTQRTIIIRTQKVHNDIAIEVEDNGIGFDEALLNNMFGLFYAIPGTSKGTGLGLYILKQNLEKLKGKVEAQSKPGVGSKFTIFIPQPVSVSRMQLLEAV
jgi:signal transduction histidine kinase